VGVDARSYAIDKRYVNDINQPLDNRLKVFPASVLIGILFGLILLEQTYIHNTHNAIAEKKSEKQKLREENQRLQDQLAAIKQIKSQTVILPNGSVVAFSQLPPIQQMQILNNSKFINASIPKTHAVDSSDLSINKSNIFEETG
jgi:Tfp pilus assembly protein PilO